MPEKPGLSDLMDGPDGSPTYINTGQQKPNPNRSISTKTDPLSLSPSLKFRGAAPPASAALPARTDGDLARPRSSPGSAARRSSTRSPPRPSSPSRLVVAGGGGSARGGACGGRGGCGEAAPPLSRLLRGWIAAAHSGSAAAPLPLASSVVDPAAAVVAATADRGGLLRPLASSRVDCGGGGRRVGGVICEVDPHALPRRSFSAVVAGGSDGGGVY